MGELDDSSGLKVVMDDLDVLTFDLVMEPSVKGAVMRPVTSVVMLPDEYKEHDKVNAERGGPTALLLARSGNSSLLRALL